MCRFLLGKRLRVLSNVKTGKLIIAAIVALLAGSVTSSRAQTLSFGLGATLEGDATNQTLFDSGNSANDGAVSTWVVSDSAIDSSGYIFIYQLENLGPDEITQVNFNRFNVNDVINVNAINGTGSYSNITLSLLPGAVAPTATSNPNFTYSTTTEGGAATFDLFPGDSGLGTNTVSWFFVIDTDVSSFNAGYSLTEDNFNAHGDILAETYALYTVPEPSSVILLTGGILCFYLVLRCRRAMS